MWQIVSTNYILVAHNYLLDQIEILIKQIRCYSGYTKHLNPLPIVVTDEISVYSYLINHFDDDIQDIEI